MGKTSARILAAGGGIESKARSNVLFKPSIRWAYDACVQSGIEDIAVIGEPGEFAAQLPQNTVFLAELERDLAGDVLILYADAPLIDAETLTQSLQIHRTQNNAVTQIGNAAYWVNTYLYGVIKPGSMNHGDKKIGLVPTNATSRVTDSRSLLELNNRARWREIDRHLQNGVLFLSTDGVMIGDEVQIGRGTTILPGTILRGKVVIGKNCTIGPNTLIEDSVVGDGCTVNACQIYKSKLHDHITMGPFCHIRPNSELCDNVHIGDFVEVKNSVIGDGTHIAHLSYVGDSDVGKKVNFGGGVITVNYDGKYKHRTVVGDRAFIGCNSNLVAPVTIGERGFTAAGSTITGDVPANALGIARARQVNKDGWVNGHEMKE